MVRKYLTNSKTLINRTAIGLMIWLAIGVIFRLFLREERQQHKSDVQMAEVFVNDHPELKATWKQLDDGRIKIKPRKGKPLYLKDGVVTNGN